MDFHLVIMIFTNLPKPTEKIICVIYDKVKKNSFGELVCFSIYYLFFMKNNPKQQQQQQNG